MPEKFDVDDRTFTHEVSIPGVGNFGLAPPIFTFWLYLGAVCNKELAEVTTCGIDSNLFLQYLGVVSVINAICAVTIWFGVVHRRGTQTAALVSYGVIIPVTLILPYFLITLLDVRNVVLSAPLIVVPPLNILRCMEALHGTSRSYVEAGFSQFLAYYVSPVTFVFDRKTGKVQRATNVEILSKLKKLIPGLVETTLLLNLLLSSDHYYFPTRTRESFVDFWYWGNVMNNLSLAYLTEIYLEFGTRSAAIVISMMTGLETIEVNDSPLSQSTSVSEFWGRRWNRLVGELLRVS